MPNQTVNMGKTEEKPHEAFFSVKKRQKKVRNKGLENNCRRVCIGFSEKM